ncbi:MAG: PKD domain-containing protein, partial [Pseudomonadota bacterium]
MGHQYSAIRARAAMALMLVGATVVAGAGSSPAAPSDGAAMTEALKNRLGLGTVDRTRSVQGAEVRRGGDVLPEFDERTSMHLDLVGQSPTDNTRRRLAIGDFDRNGLEDVFVARWEADAQLFLNDATVLTRQTGAFETASDVNDAHHAGVLDGDNDGWLDLIVRNRFLRNRGEDMDGNWLGFASGVAMTGAENDPFSIETADFDGDGDIDAVTAPGRRMLVNNGSGAFAHDGSRMGSNTLNSVIKFAAGDFDGDGDVDLAGPRQSEDRHYVYYNDGTGRFTNGARLSLNLDTLTYVQAGADFNDDGIADFRIYADFENPRAFMSTGTFTGGFPDYVRRVDPVIEGDQGKHGLAHVRDVDNDGDLDFALSSIELFSDRVDLLNEKNNLIVNSGNNSGTFVSVFDPEWGDEEAYDVKLMDVNDDGNFDLFIAHETRLAIYINGAPPQTLSLTGHTSLATQVGELASMTVTVDGGVSPSFSWDFGDGSPAVNTATPDTSHTYAQPGRYPVTVTVTAGASSDSLVFWHTAFAERVAGTPAHSAAMAYQALGGAADDDRLVMVNSDHDSVTIMRVGDGAILAELPVGDRPVSVARADNQAFVVNKDDATISVIDLTALAVTDTLADLPRGSQPHGIVMDTQGDSPVAVVALEGLGAIARVDTAGGGATVQPLGPTPRELAISADQSSLYVSRFITAPVPGEHTRTLGTAGGGDVWVLGTTDLGVQATALLPYNDQPDDVFSARGIPNYLMAPVIAPSGAYAFVPA